MKFDYYKNKLWHKFMESKNRDIIFRYLHSLAVVDAAVNLVERFNFDVDIQKIKIAALLHDCAKFEENKRFIAIAKKQPPFRQYFRYSRKTWHALFAPVILEEDFNIYDKEIQEAVQWHTTGHQNMSLLAEIIFLADIIDATRIDDCYDEIKLVSKTNFHAAIALKIKQKIEELNDYSEEQIKLYNKYAEVKWKF